jgi:hypothetical protein
MNYLNSITFSALIFAVFAPFMVAAQISATVTGGNCAGSFTLPQNGSFNGKNKYSGTVAITIAPFGTQNIPVDMQWSGTQWEIVAQSPIGVVFANNTPTSPIPPCHTLGTWVAGMACAGGNITASSGDCAVIPVELYAFSGKNTDNQTILTWKTANEIGFRGFEIERSLDGKMWESLDFMAGKGDNSTYVFVDKAPLHIGHYRLRQIDYNGDTELSKTIVVQSVTKKSAVRVFPNPNTEGVIFIENLPNERAEIVLTNALGQIVLRQISENTTANLTTKGKLAKGIYFLNIQSKNVFFTQKITTE